MHRYADVLDTREPIRVSFWGAVALHVAVLGGLTLAGYVTARPRETWGDPNALGGSSVSITPVQQIPLLANQGPRNPVAVDTESQVPVPPKPDPKRAVKEDPSAIALKSRQAQKTKPAPVPRWWDDRRAPRRELADNQLTSGTGQAVSSPLYGMTPGSGAVGVGTGSPFGTRFGAYAGIVRDRVAQKWRTDEVDARLNTAPPVVVTFEILRDGSARNIRIAQSSNVLSLDNCARRAIAEAGPFPPLPAQYEGSAATIEFWFQLKR